MKQGIKVISLLQPWASLVVMGFKKIETRSWNTNYRGPLLIHASKGKSGAEIARSVAISRHMPDFKALPFGMIIGQVVLSDVILLNDAIAGALDLPRLTLEEKAFGDYKVGRYGLVFKDALAFDEWIPATGRLGIWEI